MTALTDNIAATHTAADHILHRSDIGTVIDAQLLAAAPWRRTTAAAVLMTECTVIQMRRIDIGKIKADMALLAVLQNIGNAVHHVMGDIAVLRTGGRVNAHASGVAVLTGHRSSSLALADGVLNLLDRALMAGLAVREMGGKDLVKG